MSNWCQMEFGRLDVHVDVYKKITDKKKKLWLLLISNLDYFAPLQDLGSALPFPAVHVSTLAGGLSHVFSLPPPFVQTLSFTARAELSSIGASATATTTPVTTSAIAIL
jgi:hypothetical protein